MPNPGRDDKIAAMQIVPTEIPDVRILIPKKHGDNRGFFSEVYSRKLLADAGITTEFVQDNHSLSAAKGVLRGLHYQIAPMAQDKLIRVVRGAILDVAVDIRKSSPSFGRHIAAAEFWRSHSDLIARRQHPTQQTGLDILFEELRFEV